tara:strand:- start:531 stop:1133 length:603 start_codon:yes stop_codon:yes gene_type:complete
MDNATIAQAVDMMNPKEQVAVVQNATVKAAQEIGDNEFLEMIKPQLRVHEGQKLNEKGQHVLYKDSLGKMTGGIGHLITEKDKKYFGKPEGTVVDLEDVIKWEQDDTKTALKDAKDFLGKDWDKSSLAVKEVATNMAFNLGKTKLSKFTGLQKAMKDGDMKKAAEEILFNTDTGEISKYASQVGKRATDLAAILNPQSRE